MIPNFDYKISQFNDFYNLESNNFDDSQQQLAQRLIGYQSRDYLENLFVNDVSQYKFYQGYIREKGTQNAIDKILKAQYEGEDINLELYPEWMIRTGRFGNTDSVENIQITLKDNEDTADPQSIELFDTTNETRSIRDHSTLDKDPCITNRLSTRPQLHLVDWTTQRRSGQRSCTGLQDSRISTIEPGTAHCI